MTAQEFLTSPPTEYSDWFGKRTNHEDYADAVGIGKPPDYVFREGFMLCLVWDDRIVVTGYDGNEYCHAFTFVTQSPTDPQGKPK